MMKKYNNIIKIFLILIIIIPTFLEPMVVRAATKATTIQGLRQELAGLQAEKKKQQNSKNQTQAEINATNNNIYAAYQQMDKAEKDVEIAKEKIIESEKEIAKVTEETNELMRYMQVIQNDNAFLGYISNATSMTDLIMRIESVEQITDYNQVTLKNLENMIVENQDLQKELAKKQKELAANLENYQGQLGKLNHQMSALNELNEDINSQIKNQEALIKYYKSVCTSETQQLSSCVTVLSDTGWNKPTTRGVMTSPWGYRVDPITGKTKSFHNGVDIGGNKEGTNVYSAAAGKVAAITHQSNCGGNIVYIHHIINGVAYTTQYAHLLSYKVKVGDDVTAATVIGTVGGGSQTKSYDKCSTGAHLHFAVHKGHYLGGGNNGYSSWSTFISMSVQPNFFPGLRVWWYKR